jgi:predicted anti-sigma-YlaC factor YlaD
VLTCREVSRAVAADELERAGLWQRLGVRLHLLMCRHCRRYAAQLRAIGETARELFRGETEDRGRIERLRRAVQQARPPGDGDAED